MLFINSFLLIRYSAIGLLVQIKHSMRGSRNFFLEGIQPQPGQMFFFQSSTYFTVYKGGPMVQRKLYFSKDPEESNIYQARGGGEFQLFSGMGGGGGGSRC